MKKIFTIGILFFLAVNCFSQLEPKQNYENLFGNGKLKRLSIMYYTSEDTTKSEGRLALEKLFDSKGKLIRKYSYTFWDVVSYEHTTTYLYDLNGNLIEETIIQQILNHGKRDEEFIKAMGNNPINEKTFYNYDTSNRLTKEINYIFGKEEFDKTKELDQTVEYFYDKNGLLQNKVGKTPNGLNAYKNYSTTYKYDEMNRKTKEIQTFKPIERRLERIISYSYNSYGLLETEDWEDSGIQINNRQLKFEYDSLGRKIKKLRYSSKNNDWIIMDTFNYDVKGNLIFSGDDQSTFYYYQNGLLKREIWKGKSNKEVVNFTTSYECY